MSSCERATMMSFPERTFDFLFFLFLSAVSRRVSRKFSRMFSISSNASIPTRMSMSLEAMYALRCILLVRIFLGLTYLGHALFFALITICLIPFLAAKSVSCFPLVVIVVCLSLCLSPYDVS